VNVSIVRGGGIAGVATRTELASDALPPEDGRRLRELAEAVEPASDAGARGPDELVYKVTINSATIAIYTETTLPETVRALIDFVSARPERQDALDLPGKR
jgi:hypothetical protein